MKKKKNREFWENSKNQSEGFRQYYNRLTELSISMFEWKGLPDTIDYRFMELALFTDGYAVFFKDDGGLGYLCLRCGIGGQLDVYQIPTDRYAYASNGYYYELNNENSVIIFNNMIHTPSTLDVEVFAKRLSDLDRSIDINAKAQKTPVLIQCEETQRLTMKNLYYQYEGNSPVIYGDKNLNPNAIKVLKTDAPYVADKLYELRTQIWNEAMTYLGISNISYQKSERLITDEVIRNQGGTIASRYSRLNARREACKAINNMFGLNISCDYREDYRELAGDQIESETEDGGVSQEVHVQ